MLTPREVHMFRIAFGYALIDMMTRGDGWSESDYAKGLRALEARKIEGSRDTQDLFARVFQDCRLPYRVEGQLKETLFTSWKT